MTNALVATAIRHSNRGSNTLIARRDGRNRSTLSELKKV